LPEIFIMIWLTSECERWNDLRLSGMASPSLKGPQVLLPIHSIADIIPEMLFYAK